MPDTGPEDRIAELIEMAREWPVLESDGGDVFSGDVLIKELGKALEASRRQIADLMCGRARAD